MSTNNIHFHGEIKKKNGELGGIKIMLIYENIGSSISQSSSH